MNIPGLANLPAAAGAQQPATSSPAAVAGDTAGAPASPVVASGGSQQQAGKAAVSSATLAQAVNNLQAQIGQQESSVALTVGLDSGGGHPGQLLVELKDNLTQQVFVRYYVPAEQVARAAGGDSGSGVAPGTLLQGKA